MSFLFCCLINFYSKVGSTENQERTKVITSVLNSNRQKGVSLKLHINLHLYLSFWTLEPPQISNRRAGPSVPRSGSAGHKSKDSQTEPQRPQLERRNSILKNDMVLYQKP